MSQFIVRLVAGDLPFLIDVNRMWGNICMIMHSNIVSSCSYPQLLHCMSLLRISASTHSHRSWSTHVDESANAAKLYKRAGRVSPQPHHHAHAANQSWPPHITMSDRRPSATSPPLLMRTNVQSGQTILLMQPHVVSYAVCSTTGATG